MPTLEQIYGGPLTPDELHIEAGCGISRLSAEVEDALGGLLAALREAPAFGQTMLAFGTLQAVAHQLKIAADAIQAMSKQSESQEPQPTPPPRGNSQRPHLRIWSPPDDGASEGEPIPF